MNKRNPVILALDQGTTSSRTVALNSKGGVITSSQKEFSQIFPQKGWVEHDPKEILESQLQTLNEVSDTLDSYQIVSIGITNQRETTIVWEKLSGEPVYNAIVWQDQRTSQYCQSLSSEKKKVKEKTGLIIDSYFSASKIRWILDNIEKGQERAERGELCFGTVDSWLLWNLTEERIHKTDLSNASRTLLFNIHSLEWDDELLSIFNIPRAMLPDVCHTVHDFGELRLKENRIPINALVGDQQSALFGQACFKKGMAKNTYGTGCFMLMNTGESSIDSEHGLLSTIAWGDGEKVTYALEGSVFVAGSAIQWLRDGLKLIDTAPDSEYYATKAASKDGVYVVPAFAGLGAPYWDMNARGAIFGLTRDTGKDHIIKATLESIAYQCKDVLQVMNQDSGIDTLKLSVDGGASANDLLMQFQSDVLQIEVERPKMVESTAIGAAYLAGIGCGLWTKEEITDFRDIDKVFQPKMTDEEMNRLYHGWKKAVERTKNWMDD